MHIEKALINDCIHVSKVPWKFHISTIYNFAVIYPQNLLFSYKVAYFLIVSILSSFYKQNFTLNNLKTKTALNAKISVFVISVEVIIHMTVPSK